jgi:hypothetical protein
MTWVSISRPAQELGSPINASYGEIDDVLMPEIEVAPLVKTALLVFKWKLCGVGLSMGVCVALQSSMSARAGG